jgi:hypothetical protein
MHFGNWIGNALLLVALLTGAAATKPKVRVADDGFPTGQSTAEGAAGDLARAFMQGNSALFRTVCLRPYGAGRSRTEYVDYLDNVEIHLKQQKSLGASPPDNPKRITKVFAARHLTKNGPASYGYAAFDFQDVMFVDVEVVLIKGTSLVRRTLVIQDHDGKWYALPVPDISPLLSAGVYDESASSTFVQ